MQGKHSEREGVEVNQKGKGIFAEKEEDNLPHSYTSLFKRRKYKWTHGYVYIHLSRRHHIYLYGDVSRVELFTRSVIELCVKDRKGRKDGQASYFASEISKAKE